MSGSERPSSDIQKLRSRAEKKRGTSARRDVAKMTSSEIAALIHELETHQIELELQNEDLRQAQIEISEMRDIYADIYDFAPIGYVMLSATGLILQSNLTFAKMLGVPRSNLINRRLTQYIFEEDQDAFYRHRANTIDKRDAQNCELRIVTDEGNQRWVGLDSVCVDPEDEGNKQIRLAISDISERKDAVNRQAQLQHDLEQAQKMEALGRLTGGIAHDFNNILGIVMGFTELTRARCLDEGNAVRAKHLGYVLKASERAKILVKKIMTFSRDGTVDDEPLELKPLVTEDLGMLLSTLPSSIEISTSLEDGLPPVLMDATQLNQLLINLFANARDSMEGKGFISMHLKRARDLSGNCTACRQSIEGDWIELSITDTGSGIRLTDMQRIFEPFYTTKDVGKGTGLGLSVIHGIMHNHGGHIKVETELNHGTTFRLLFPPFNGDVNQEPGKEPPPAKWQQGQNERALVLDDEQQLGEITADLLRSCGYQATVFTSSLKALESFLETPDQFDIVISDQTMPEMTGVEFANAIRKARPDVPIILNTGFSDSLDPDEAKKMGVSYLEKPIKLEVMAQMVANLLKKL